tara:strand:- start:1903 stop:2613 length:711 start_codon:yes stop_codon:yes gene_type:complete
LEINFANQNILVTGGTKGIGKKLVEEFKSLGGKVWYTGRNNKLRDENYFCVDFNNCEKTDKFLKKVESIDFDVLINNAGTNKIGDLENYDSEDFEMILNLNLTSCFKTTKAVIPNMKRKRYGKIINITSISSQISMPQRSAYCSSKFGLFGLTKASAVELAEHNILVNSIGPGVTETELTVDVLGFEVMKDISKNVPIGRLAKVDDISNVVMFMASNLNTYIVGQNIIVDGGFTSL